MWKDGRWKLDKLLVFIKTIEWCRSTGEGGKFDARIMEGILLQPEWVSTIALTLVVWYNTAMDHLVPDNQSASNRYQAQSIMAKRGFCPFTKMMDLAEKLEKVADVVDPDTGELIDQKYVKERINIYNNLTKFYAAQPKAIDISYTSDQKYTIQAVNFAALAQERNHLIPEAGNYSGPDLSVMLANTTKGGDSV